MKLNVIFNVLINAVISEPKSSNVVDCAAIRAFGLVHDGFPRAPFKSGAGQLGRNVIKLPVKSRSALNLVTDCRGSFVIMG